VDGPKAGTVDTVYYFYDVLNRQIGMIGPDPDNSGPRPRSASKTIYDNDGRVSEVDAGTVTGTDTNALNAMTIVRRDTTTFDTATGVAAIGRHFIGTASTPQNVTQTSYDALFRADCVAARLNPTDYASLPASACTLGTTGADGSHDRITKYAYDGDSAVLNTQSPYGTSAVRYDVSKGYDPVSGLTTAVSDAKGNVTRYYYDSFDRVVKTCYATASNGGVTNTSDCEQVTYTTGVVNGTTQSLTRPSNGIRRDGQTINFGYDNVGRFLGTSGAVSEVYSYDNFGQMLTHTNYTTGGSGAPSATEIYSYNALGWLNSDTQPAGTVSYQYDANGKRSRMTWPDGFYVTYGFDDGDELTGIFENGTAQIAGFGYDTYGRRNALTRPNGFNDGYGFDGALRLQTQALVASGVSNTITLGYNQANQITSRTNSNTASVRPVHRPWLTIRAAI
ncbi:MAG: hypothetical protein JF615_14535, partial [Asticcacaulis sp.]|nr:hypothetical protein [Asticcacaulis sp.]